MLVPNSNIWATRIQNVDALVTASADGRVEVYYLATVCQVGLEPPLVSISPNPEYPICAAIQASGQFGVHFLGADQGPLIQRCIDLDRHEPDKLAALGLAHEPGERGTPLLLDCLQSLECQVVRFWDSGDHRTFIGQLVARRVRPAREGQQPHRFGGQPSGGKRLLKMILCRTRVYGLVEGIKGLISPPVGIEEGTRRMCDPVVLPTSMRRHRAPSPAGICLVGCGWWGKVHGLALKGMGSRIQRFFASHNRESAREFARRFDGSEAFAGLEAALADPRVHAVLLALPHHLHAEAARAALAAGKHVLVEKPLALTTAEGEELVRLADDAGLCLAVAEQYRLSPLVREARAVIRSGELGRISLVQAGSVGTFAPGQDWKNSSHQMGGGVLMDVGVHYIDVLRYWFGEPEMVWATSPPQMNPRLGGEDGVVVLLRFAAGPLVNLTISWAACRGPDAPHLEVMGERGSLRLWFDRPYLLQTAPLDGTHWSSRVRRRMPWRVEQMAGRMLPSIRRQRRPVSGGDLLGSQALIEDFVQAITSGAEPGVPGAEGVRDLRVIQAAYASRHTGAAVTLTV